jgi:hypothetical protein
MAKLAPPPSEPKKDTIYIDVDDEITAIIEKLRKSPQRIVALVLPKRATVLQSIVNMKLLKRTADKSQKNVVLITSEAGLLPLAGAVGMHVASSLQSRPEIPPAPGEAAADDTIPEDALEDDAPEADFAPRSSAKKSVGALAGNKYSEPETIQLDNEVAPESPTDAPVAATGNAAAIAAQVPKKGKNKKLKVPNFNKFRTILICSILAVILLVVGFVWANTALPKAEISLKTNSQDVDTKASVILDPTADQFDPASNVLPAKIASKQQTGSQQVSTTGQKNNGQKATGTVSVTVVCTKKPAPINAGTGFSAGSLTFISTNDVSFTPSGFDSDGNVVCNGNASLVAQQAGTKYNVDAGTKFSVAGNSDASSQNGSAFSGGTDNIVKVVAQADIDGAKAKITAGDNSGIKTDLIQQLKAEGYTAISSTLNAGDPKVTSSAQVGDQADTVTVTQVATYTMYGVKQSDVKKLITLNVNKKIDTTKQEILNDGVSRANYQVAAPASSGPLDATLTATSLAGPDIDTAKLAEQFAGKKTGDIKTIVQAIPGVSDVDVKYSPFWVHSVPKKTSKIKILIIKADGGTASTDSSSDDDN